MVRTYRSLFAALVVACAAWTVPAHASAQEDSEEFQDEVHVVQKKPVLVGQRLELAPRFGVSVNDSVYRSFKVGGNLDYHITERLHVGGLFEWYNFGGALGGRTRVFDNTFEVSRTAADAPVVSWAGALEGGFAPIYGKFALFNRTIVHYDFGATLGAGVVNSESLVDPESGVRFGVTGSLYSHLYLNDWLALNVRVRDFLFQSQLAGGTRGESVQTFSNLVTVSMGVSLYVPTSFEYAD